MMMLHDPNIKFLILSFEGISEEINFKFLYERATSILYSKDYTILPISNYIENISKNCLLAISDDKTNDELRSDGLYLLEAFDQKSLIIKYQYEKNAVELKKNGSENLLKIVSGPSFDENSNLFVYEGNTFTFHPLPRYYFPRKKEDLKDGMIVEYVNNEKEWIRKPILDIDSEYERFFKLLIKYNKLRVEIPQN